MATDNPGMTRRRSESDEQVAELLRTARKALGLHLSFLTRMDGTTQHLEVVDSAVPFVFRDGATQVQGTSLCQAILDGDLPAVIPDLTAHPAAMALPAARMPRLRSYVSVPVRLSDGSLYGTFCAAGFTADDRLTLRDRALMEVLAQAAATVIEPGVVERARHETLRHRLEPVVADGGPVIHLQPIVHLASGERVGAEALSRFPAAWELTPDVCFEQAHTVGLGVELELLAIRRALALLDEVTGYVAVNASPGVLLDPAAAALLGTAPAHRVLLELSEHEQVEDYAALAEVLRPLRERGLRLAIDDVGSGYSSLRHIVVTAPDVIKLDRSIVAGVSTDPVLATLTRSLVDLARSCGASVVAEGVETGEDAARLAALGVDHGQGWYFGRPGPADQLGRAAGPSPAVPVPGPRPGGLKRRAHRD